MSTKQANQVSVTVTVADATPPYIPWKTLEGYIANLQKTIVPHTVDNSVRPPSMSGGLWRQLGSALRFLRLVDSQGITQEGLNALANAHGTPKWKEAISKHVLSAYKPVVDGLSITNATPAQLDARFKERGKVNGQMLEKSIRFYLHAMREAGVEYSKLLIMRRDRRERGKAPKAKAAEGSASKKQKTRKNAEETPPPHEPEIPKGYTEFPLRDGRRVIVPKDLTKGDAKTISAYLNAFVGEGEDE